MDGHETAVSGLELHDATVRVVDPVERLSVGVGRRPAAPAVLPVPRHNLGVHIEPVAVLETKVALVHGLETGPTRCHGGDGEQGPAQGKTGDHPERVPSGPPDRKLDRRRAAGRTSAVMV